MNNYCTHCFSVELATKIGMREAVILQHFYWWHQHNAALKSMNIDGRVWFYLSAAKIQEVFPYLSAQAVKTILGHLINDGYLIKDHKGEGQDKFDRTTWYSLTDRAIQLFHLPISTNGDAEINPIVNNNNIVNNISSNEENINISNPKPRKFDFLKALLAAGVEPEVAQAWMQVRKAKKAVNTEIAWKAVERELSKTSTPAGECIRFAVEHSWSGFKAEWMENEKAPRTAKPAPAAAPAPRDNSFARMMEVGKRLGIIAQSPYDKQ